MSTLHAARRLVVAGTLAASVAGCHSTELAAVWHDQAATPVQFNHTIVAFVTTDESLRRTVEDKLAASFPGGTPSYRIVPSAAAADSSDIRRKLADLGYDGAVVMRVANVDVSPSDPYGTYWYRSPYGFGNYWGSSWGYPYNPGYAYTNTVVSIETELYSLTSDRMVWAARSETTNPASAGKLTDSVIRHVTKKLRKDGYLAFLAHPLDKATSIAVE